MRRHRWWSAPLALLLSLSLSHCAAPPRPKPAPAPAPQSAPAPTTPTPPTTPVPPPVAAPAPAPAPAETPPAPVPPPAPTAAPITLILPLDSPDFRGAAEAVRLGFMAAQTATASKLAIDVRRTDGSTARVLQEYDAALAGGTRVVVGPLTRSGVSALAGAPAGGAAVLALNQPQTPVPLPQRFFTFGLSVEGESRAAARAAWDQGLKGAVVLSSGTPLAKRSTDAFVDEFTLRGGRVASVQEATVVSGYGQLKAALGKLEYDSAFLAAEATAARLLRPYAGSAIPVFATSQVNDGRNDPIANVDMNGVRFVDMPWIVQPDSPTVVGFPRPQGMPVELERFYALGIDAQRIAVQLADGRERFRFDGVTGAIEVGSGGTVERTPRLATYRDGIAVGE